MGAQPVESQEAPAEPLKTWTIFEKGQDLSVRLSYSGGLEGWDAAFGYDGERLRTDNAAFITVTDSEGKKVEPGAGKLVSRWVNSREKKPFDTRVNLAEVYDMSKPGRYIVEWGCKKVASQVIRIEIVERNADNEGGQAEQVEEGGADQTTTAPKSKGEKPNPDSKERPAISTSGELQPVLDGIKKGQADWVYVVGVLRPYSGTNPKGGGLTELSIGSSTLPISSLAMHADQEKMHMNKTVSARVEITHLPLPSAPHTQKGGHWITDIKDLAIVVFRSTIVEPPSK